jgi:hypothetical protein
VTLDRIDRNPVGLSTNNPGSQLVAVVELTEDAGGVTEAPEETQVVRSLFRCCHLMGLWTSGAHARRRRGRAQHALRIRKRVFLKSISSILGIVLVGAGAYAATNWVVGLSGGSSAEGQAAGIANISITAVATPAAGNLLYPGGTGDVVITIANTNPYAVTITAVQLPTSTTYANGYTTSALATLQPGCISTTPSGVTWSFATSTSGSSHALTTPLVVGASGNSNNPLAVTLTNDASMATTAPAACASTYFSMPAFTGVTATGGAGTATVTPATDGWTS